MWACLVLAGLPAALTTINLLVFRGPRSTGSAQSARVSILIPARDEEGVIGAAVAAALESEGVEIEVVVIDDGSRDRTAEIVRDWGAKDPRVRLIESPPLPDGWCGKQHACARLAEAARYEWLLFHDADVSLAADAASRLVAEAEAGEADLLSGVPHQETGTFGEKLIIPLIHFVLLGFLPLPAARSSGRPSFAAGCGQVMFARRSAYEATGGHAAVRGFIHDGLSLPRNFRSLGFKTDLVDLTAQSRCRMYDSFQAVWEGFAKNAHEGMATPAGILPWTLLLLGGQVMPFVLALVLATAGHPQLPVALAAVALAWGTRLVLTIRFRQSWLGALLHPLGVAAVVAIQWYALVRRARGQPVLWKGRVPA